jgi:hypothetical protein
VRSAKIVPCDGSGVQPPYKSLSKSLPIFTPFAGQDLRLYATETEEQSHQDMVAAPVFELRLSAPSSRDATIECRRG